MNKDVKETISNMIVFSIVSSLLFGFLFSAYVSWLFDITLENFLLFIICLCCFLTIFPLIEYGLKQYFKHPYVKSSEVE